MPPADGRMRMQRVMMDDITTRMDNAATQIQQTLTNMDRDIKLLLGDENWQGTERQEYDTQQLIWNQSAAQMHGAALTGGATLQKMVDNVDVTEAVNRKAWQNVYG
ncbi:WXG100 family type VII secretion target [Actinomadura decatromicini]|uniref:WXG100 family type VII secretion target n=1 Tax=Actinomadura decatromicini TaxID=2604572 RepID=A0A5D3F1Z0_9ACTN|nr:WXG100 family type VII secretion target [Actinomadura decatromicini]TYK43067.1 hypothetical protein FXF68_40005 [Actinomadura decatromicini]